MWRYIRRSLLGLSALILVLVVVVVGINAFDDELTPDARALLLPPPNSWPADQNLYLSAHPCIAVVDEEMPVRSMFGRGVFGAHLRPIGRAIYRFRKLD